MMMSSSIFVTFSLVALLCLHTTNIYAQHTSNASAAASLQIAIIPLASIDTVASPTAFTMASALTLLRNITTHAAVLYCEVDVASHSLTVLLENNEQAASWLNQTSQNTLLSQLGYTLQLPGKILAAPPTAANIEECNSCGDAAISQAATSKFAKAAAKDGANIMATPASAPSPTLTDAEKEALRKKLFGGG